MKKIEKVCVVAAGAIGSLLVGHLGAIVDMAVLARRDEHAKALNAEGLRVSGKSELHANVRASTDAADLVRLTWSSSPPRRLPLRTARG